MRGGGVLLGVPALAGVLVAGIAELRGGSEDVSVEAFFGSLTGTITWVLCTADRYALRDRLRALLVFGACVTVVVGWCVGLTLLG